jgi:protein involved in polysaccharide export with SLBB domain
MFKYNKSIIFFIFFIFSPVYSQTYEEIIKLREQYDQLKQSQIEATLTNDGESILKSEEDTGPTRIIYKPEDLDEFYRTQLSQLTKSLYDLNQIKSFFDSTNKLTHFGYNLFTNRDTISFFDNMPLPANYTLGSGDEVNVSLWGEVEKEETSIINREGNIFLDDIGIVSLRGSTLSQAKKKIENSYSKTYSTIKGENPSTFIDISLGQLKGLNIHILGSVKYPGVYAMHPFSDPFTALFYAGGIDTIGSLRDIQVHRNGIKLHSIDLYDIIHGGSIKEQIRLLDQDIIFVPSRKSKVIVNGAITIPGYFELINSETALDLINYAGGLATNASSVITLKRIQSPFSRQNDDLAINYFHIPIDSLPNYKMQNGDSLTIDYISNYYPTITINGWVKRPGQYPFIKGMSLIQLFEIGGGLFDENWLLGSQDNLVSVIKLDKNGNTKTINYDYNQIINGSVQITLNPYDEVQVAKSINNNFENYISIEGAVKAEGIYSISSRSIIDIINDAGGFLPNAYKEGIELYRDTIKVGINSLSIIPLHGDSIYVPTPPGSVKILGSVNNPGPVSFQRDLSINEFIDLAGGYGTYANKKDVFIIYPNGIARKKNRFSSPIVLDGSTIMVSTNQLVVEQTNYLEVTQQIASIIGSLATVALIINTQSQ